MASPRLSIRAQFETWGETNRAWFETAEELSVGAINGALARAGLTAADVDALYVVSVTGIASPSLDLVVERRSGRRAGCLVNWPTRNNMREQD